MATYHGHILPERLSGEAGYMPDDGREVGGAPELELRQTLLVGSNHALDAWDRASRSTSISGELKNIHTCWRRNLTYHRRMDWMD